MRGGYPVRLQRVTEWKKSRLAKKPYWRVGAGMAGHCDHRHRTEGAAKKCIKPMTLKYRETRWPGSTKK